MAFRVVWPRLHVFSGAVQAWLVDALTFAGYFRDGRKLETVLARGEIVEGAAMLGGSVAGGLIAQATNLGVPYLLRTIVLIVTVGLAFRLMHDIGTRPRQALVLTHPNGREILGQRMFRWEGAAMLSWV